MTILLKDILEIAHGCTLQGDPLTPVTGVTHDSRRVSPGWLFAALTGQTTDGHAYIPAAVAAGAAAILGEKPAPEGWTGVPYLHCPEARMLLGPIASLVYGRPTAALKVIGVTGTNGKTTLSYLLEAILKEAGLHPGVIGTISYRWAGAEHAAPHTTPEASDLQRLLAQMRSEGVTHVVMEVSSHGLHRGRLEGCLFDVGVFTNLTQDHLDYHGTLEDYFEAKKLLFTRLLPASASKEPWACINGDDQYGRRLRNEITAVTTLTYGLGATNEVRAEDVSVTPAGIWGSVKTPSGFIEIQSQLTGSFNLSNILAAVSAAWVLGIDEEAIARGIAGLSTVPGRLEKITWERGTVFVDYAHTPDALRNVIEALHALRGAGRIITLMGCGGDRDKSKRPLMGFEAARGSDFVVVTSDNPRSEDPLEIIGQVEEGVCSAGFRRRPAEDCDDSFDRAQYTIIPDRRKAISAALRMMRPGDILLVAGKGHETYQEIRGVRHAFDDRAATREEIARIHEELERRASAGNCAARNRRGRGELQR